MRLGRETGGCDGVNSEIGTDKLKQKNKVGGCGMELQLRGSLVEPAGRGAKAAKSPEEATDLGQWRTCRRGGRLRRNQSWSWKRRWWLDERSTVEPGSRVMMCSIQLGLVG